MLIRITIFYFLITIYTKGKADDLQPIRKMFHEAVMDSKSVDKFYSAMQTNTSADPIHLAYKGVSIAMSAQNEWNPYEKYQRVLAYTKLLDKALQLSPNDIEIHFLRLCVEYHLPVFLQNKDKLMIDIEFLKNNIKEVSELKFDSAFSRYIAFFFYETKLLNPQELAELHKELDVEIRVK